jgi:hypothetical protein
VWEDHHLSPDSEKRPFVVLARVAKSLTDNLEVDAAVQSHSVAESAMEQAMDVLHGFRREAVEVLTGTRRSRYRATALRAA